MAVEGELELLSPYMAAFSEAKALQKLGVVGSYPFKAIISPLVLFEAGAVALFRVRSQAALPRQ